MKHTITSKRIMIDILSIFDQVYQEYKKDHEFSLLLEFLKEKDFLNDDDIPFPTMKVISEKLGIESTEVRKKLLKLYDKLFDYENGLVLDFSNVEIHFSLKYFDQFGFFSCKELKYLPRIGENITIPFLRAKLGTDYFYVESIRNRFEGTTHFIEYKLNPGYYNSYLYNMRHKAVEEDKISLKEFYILGEFGLKRKLKIGRYKYTD